MLELFVFGSIWFWLLVVLEIVLLFVWVEHEQGVLATISILIFVAIMHFAGNIDVINFVKHHPVQLIASIVTYFLCGTVWGIVKWWIYCKDQYEEYNGYRTRYLQGLGLIASDEIPEKHKKDFRDSMERNYGYGRHPSKPPLASEHKAQILRWMTFWVISMIWTFIDDFVRRIFKTIYQSIAAHLQSISDNVYQQARKDMGE